MVPLMRDAMAAQYAAALTHKRAASLVLLAVSRLRALGTLRLRKRAGQEVGKRLHTFAAKSNPTDDLLTRLAHVLNCRCRAHERQRRSEKTDVDGEVVRIE